MKPLNANTGNAPGPDKAALRRAVLARRAGLSPDEVRRASLAASILVDGLDRWRSAREVMVYFAFKGEVETSALLEGLWRRGVRVLAPRCRPGEAGVLDVACVTCFEELAPGAYGILEPHPESCPALSGFAPDVALIPAVAFDRRGGRLGFGQGYYDRLLAGPGFEKTFLIGLAHPFQVVERLPLEPWDRPVHAVVTSEEVIRVHPGE
ncbi:5-formyltetrahydrofolate cyclo-ligase [Fundidesulfovibrio terrae]|uniref:5-formyltetrahydrofolate cyclo-ligase n=1 Tax=Fundidesulfovibrio terrae TaxID=2922866 RepID=UPI001FAFA03F|nr:5-formyltetrahydrofolate cyclo-ligase [Fundidesulfovibrio terrae]